MRLVLVRIGLLLLFALLTSATLSLLTDAPFGFGLAPQLSALYFIPVNLICLWLLRRRIHRNGGTLRELAGFDRRLLGRDIALGLLWQILLFIPFALGINLIMLLLFGTSDYSGAFERVFAPDPQSVAVMAGWFSTASALLVALLFPITNAPTEELYYRGHAQGQMLRAGRPTWLALVVPSFAFGVQHLFLAPTAAGALVYMMAFFLWGLGAALIRLKTGRLMPLIVAHFFTNAMTAVVPLVLLLVL